MNAIITTAVFGIVLMFVGLFVKNKQQIKYFAIAGTILAFIANWYDGMLAGGSNA